MATVEATFVFADIAGFTALTQAHGDEAAAALVSDFAAAVREELPARGGRQVKVIGDAVAVDPDRAAGRLVHQDTTYFFCTLACAGEFARRPDRYAR